MTNYFNTEDLSFFRKKISVKDIEKNQNSKNLDKINQTKLLQNLSVQKDENVVLAFDDFESYEIPNLLEEDLDTDNETVEFTKEEPEVTTTNNTNDSNANTVNTLKSKLPNWAIDEIEKEVSEYQEGTDEYNENFINIAYNIMTQNEALSNFSIEDMGFSDDKIQEAKKKALERLNSINKNEQSNVVYDNSSSEETSTSEVQTSNATKAASSVNVSNDFAVNDVADVTISSDNGDPIVSGEALSLSRGNCDAAMTIEDIDKKIQEKEAERATAETKVQNAMDDNDNYFKADITKIQNAEKKYSDTLDKVGEVDDKCKELSSTIKSQMTAIKETEKNINKNKTEVSKLDNEISEKDVEIQNSQTRIDDLTSKVDSLSVQLSNWSNPEPETIEVSNGVDEKGNPITTQVHNPRYDWYEYQRIELENALADAEAELAEEEANHAELESQRAEMDASRTELKAEGERLASVKSEQEAAKSEKEKELNTHLSKTKPQLAQALQTQQTNISNAKTAYEAKKENRIEKLQGEVDQITDEIIELKNIKADNIAREDDFEYSGDIVTRDMMRFDKYLRLYGSKDGKGPANEYDGSADMFLTLWNSSSKQVGWCAAKAAFICCPTEEYRSAEAREGNRDEAHSFITEEMMQEEHFRDYNPSWMMADDWLQNLENPYLQTNFVRYANIDDTERNDGMTKVVSAQQIVDNNISEQIKPGDIAVFDWNGDGYMQHAATVISIEDDGTLVTSDGNSANIIKMNTHDLKTAGNRIKIISSHGNPYNLNS